MKRQRFILTVEKVKGSEVYVWVPPFYLVEFREFISPFGFAATEHAPTSMETRFKFRAKSQEVEKLLTEFNQRTESPPEDTHAPS